MIIKTKTLVLNNLTIKLVSIIIGYGLWSFLGQIYMVDQWKTVPICFYNVCPTMNIACQTDAIAIHVSGKRADLKQYDDIALHIDASKLTHGTQVITPDPEQLFVSNSIKLLHCKPLAITVEVTKKDIA